ncbi:MAG: dihydrolipoyl dehydrogenase [Thermoproteota archaeon]
MVSKRYDVVVVGGGPGGYPAAVAAAAAGARVALVEARALGGECTNYACVPTKALLKAAKSVADAAKWGRLQEVDARSIASWIEDVVSRVRDGVRYILERRGVDIYLASAHIESRNALALSTGEVIEFRQLVVATGSEPWEPPGLEPDGELVHNNRTVISALKEQPSRVLVVGGGAAGVEYAEAFAMLGAEVHLVEILERILPGMDRDLSRAASMHLRRLGVRVSTSTSVESLERLGRKVAVKLSNGVELEVDAVIIATGRKPVTEPLGVSKLGVETDAKGFVKVNERMETRVPGIYASGDVTGPPLLAHKAIHQGIVAGLNAAGGSAVYKPGYVPLVVYASLELAQVGATLEEARAAGIDAAEVRVRLGSVARGVVEGMEYGFAKLVYDRRTGKVLGGAIASPHASEMIATLALAAKKGLTVEDLAELQYPHPTVSEALGEAALAALGRAVHYVK